MLEGLDLPGHRLPATRAELLVRAGEIQAARTAYLEAVGRCANTDERDHLLRRLADLG